MLYNRSRKHRPLVEERPTQDKYDRFEEWLRQNGAQFEYLELREYDAPNAMENEEEKKEQPPAVIKSGEEESEIRGVHAKAHLPPHTVCMAIPRRCLITVEMGQETPIGQAILRSDLDLDAPKHIFLMIYLLWDRKVNGEKSFFHPYYDILPPTLRNMPIFWNAEELEFLKGSHLLQQIEDRNEAIAEDYHAICQIAPLAQICTLTEFKWARMCVCSRNFGLQIDGHRTSALVPHADMLNHFRPRETKWTFDEDRQAFTITTLQPIPAGSQVYDSYGQKCNHRFLLNYGFAVEDNRELDGFCPNEVPVELELNMDDPTYAQRLDFWMRGEVGQSHTHAPPHHQFYPPQPHTTITAQQEQQQQQQHPQHYKQSAKYAKRVRVCVSNNENTRLLFSLLRTMTCSPEELQAITSPVNSEMRSLFLGDASRTSSGYYRSCRDIRHPLSLANERAVMLKLLQIISQALAGYATSLSQDQKDLLDQQLYPPYSNVRHAKIQVRGEKEVLHHFARWARTAIQVIDVIEQDLKEEQQRGVEVQLGRGIVADDSSRSCGYDYIIRRMEEDEDGVHNTILRYCADVLGSVRREAFKNMRKQRGVMSSSSKRGGESYIF